MRSQSSNVRFRSLILRISLPCGASRVALRSALALRQDLKAVSPRPVADAWYVRLPPASSQLEVGGDGLKPILFI